MLVDVNLYALNAAGLWLGLSVVVLLVDANLLAVLLGRLLKLLGTALAVLEDSYVLSVGLAVLRRALSRLFKANREGFLMLFRVTFPSCLG